MKTNFITLCWVVFFLVGIPSVGQTGEITRANANEHLVKRIDPDYPALAKATRLQGKVVLKVTISKDGAVTAVNIVSGHPMLAPAAVQAVKQWQYKPFTVDGQAAEVSTMIEVPFSMGISEADYKKEQEAADNYFKQDEKCRGLVQAKQYQEAESSCRAAVELVEKLPTERRNERRVAYEFLGHSLFSQGKFSDAVSLYRQELTVAQQSLRQYEAELGYAYRDVARGLHATGDLKEARSNYELAENTLEEAHDHIESEFLKNKYSETLKSVLRDYALLLRQSGDTAAADAAEQKANSIVVRTNLKDN
jgi:TonB family protein